MRKCPTLYKRGFPTVVMQREYPLVANPKAGEKGQPPELMYYRRIATSDVKRQEGMYSQKAKKKKKSNLRLKADRKPREPEVFNR